ncbi:hypothetical protein JCM3774_002936 [Rhodotorula dairenensis]
MEQPAPSPAPTLDTHFPGFYPPTPSAHEPAAEPDLAPSTQPDTAVSEHDDEANKHRLEGAGIALLGAAAGFVVAGPLGAAVGGGLAGLSAVEHQGITQLAHADEPSHSLPSASSGPAATPTVAAAAVADLDPREAFGTPAVEKEQAELAHSPAQQLLAQDDQHHLGEALLAGATGAKLASNEVDEPAVGDRKADPSSESRVTTPTAATPNFGTPAIEKSQAELAHSPAQRLLAEAASSTGSETPPLRAEAALLGAAAAGATSVGKVEHEVEEPATVPVDEAVERDLQAGGGIPTTNENRTAGTGEKLTASPLDNHDESSDRPSLPMPSGSFESFSGAVLAAGSGVETPTVAPGPAASGFGMREPGSTILITDQDNYAPQESLDEQRITAAGIPLPADTPSLRSDVSIAGSDLDPSGTHSASTVSLAGSDETEKPSERNPFHLGEAAPLVGGAAFAGGALAGPELLGQAAPKDFEPYPPPTVPESVETPVAGGGEREGSPLTKLDEAPMFTAQDKGKGKAVEEALAVAAAGGGGGIAMAVVGPKSFPNDSPLDRPQQTSTFTENFDTPPVSAAMATDPLWDQRAELPSAAVQAPGQEPRRAVDPKVLAAAAAPATSAEQAGFVGAAPGGEPTPAMQDFAHLSEPAPNAQQAALASTPPSDTAVEDKERRSNALPLAAAAAGGLAGVGAGAAVGATVLAREPSSVSTPQRAAPVSRFREDTTTGSPASAQAATPSSTRANMGSPAPVMQQQQQPVPSAVGQQPYHLQQQPPFQQPQPQPQQPPYQQQGGIPQHMQAQPHEAAPTIERSAHLGIATAVVDGRKRLHRKSLSKGSPRSGRSSMDLDRPASAGGVSAPVGFAPMQQQQQPPMHKQQQQYPVQQQPPVQQQYPVQQQAVHPQARYAALPQQQQQQVIHPGVMAPGPMGSRPGVPAGDIEARRDRMMDNIVGVRDPLVSGPVIGATAPVRAAPSMGTTSPTASSPSSPLSPPGPHRVESDASDVGQRHNETHAGAPPTALGVTGVTAAVIPGMGTLPPVGGMPIPPHQQQHQHHQPGQADRSGAGVAPPTAIAPSEPTGNIQRKLSKRHPHEPVEKERKEGFFSKIFGGGSGRRSRTASSSSRNSANGSPRASAEVPRQ